MTPLVFLHGFLGSPAEWQPVIQSLQGHGSKWALPLPPAPDWTTALERVAATLPARCILIGYSLGARVALALALTYPARIRALGLVSGHGGLDPSARSARRAHDEEVARRILAEPWHEFLDGWYRQELFANVDECTRTAWMRERDKLDRQAQAELLRGYSIGGQPDYWPRLAELAMPTVVIVGAFDTKYVEVARRMQRHAPQLQLHLVPAAGHAVHRERPQACAELLQAFLANLPSEKT